MNTSGIRRRLKAIGATAGAIALVCLFVLLSAPESANNNSQKPLPLTPEGAGAPAPRPTVPNSTRTVPLRDDPPDGGFTAAGEGAWLTQPHNDAFDRFESISALGDSRDAMAELTLVNLLSDQDPAIRESAVESLASLGTYQAIQGLAIALTDADPVIRRTVVELLADIGTYDALEALAITLVDPDADLRLAAVYEIADNESEAASALLQEFLSDADPSVRQVAAELLDD